MAIFSSTQPSLRVRVLPRFPANVIAGSGMSIIKSGATYTFAVSGAAFTNLPLSALAPIATDSILGRDTAGTGPVENINIAGGLGMTGGLTLQMTANQRTRTIPFTISPGVAITTGIKGDIEVPFACVITGVTLLADQNTGATAFQLDIWKDTFANYPPTVADTITASNKPIIPIGAQKVQNATLTGWNTNINAGDILRFNVDTTSTVTRVQIAVDVTTV